MNKLVQKIVFAQLLLAAPAFSFGDEFFQELDDVSFRDLDVVSFRKLNDVSLRYFWLSLRDDLDNFDEIYCQKPQSDHQEKKLTPQVMNTGLEAIPEEEISQTNDSNDAFFVQPRQEIPQLPITKRRMSTDENETKTPPPSRSRRRESSPRIPSPRSISRSVSPRQSPKIFHSDRSKLQKRAKYAKSGRGFNVRAACSNSRCLIEDFCLPVENSQCEMNFNRSDTYKCPHCHHDGNTHALVFINCEFEIKLSDGQIKSGKAYNKKYAVILEEEIDIFSVKWSEYDQSPRSCSDEFNISLIDFIKGQLTPRKTHIK